MSDRRFAALKIFSVVLAMAPLVGCAAGAVDSAPTGQKYATLEDFCKARANAECTAIVVSKCGAPSVEACVAKRTASCKTGAPQGVTYVASNAEKCLDTIKEVYADAKLSDVEIASLGEACGSKIFSGPGGARSECNVDYDCKTQDGLVCMVPSGATTARCLVPNLVAGAAPCPGEADVCPGDYFCEAKSKTCATRAAISEPCYDLLPCQPGLACNPSPFGGGCHAKAGPGEPCKLDADCTKGVCDKLVGSTNGNCTETILLTPLDSVCEGFK